ncbi:MAG: chemotaxis protein CheA [Gemmatimonadota bacterium]
MTAGESFFHQFIEDYFAECEEHLAHARRVLLSLEQAGSAGSPDPVLIRQFLRSLHTLKGLSGMVGNAPAERVAHGLEDALRRAGESGISFSPRILDALFAGVDLLEQCVAAHRTGAIAPGETESVETLRRLLPGTATESATTASTDPLYARAELIERPAHGAGVARIYHFEFVPSLALRERGVSVDGVQDRLRGLGTLLEVKPRIVQGGVAFDFTVAVESGRTPDTSWLADGMQWTRANPSPVVPEPAPATVPGSSMVRVDLARVDGVMRLVGDLVVSRSRLDEMLKGTSNGHGASLHERLEELNDVMERQLRQLRESVMRIRLVPVGEVFERLRFAARDAIRESDKEMELEFRGQSTEIDKLVVDRMLEPLLHLVRNAVTHGIEGPTERLARGKPRKGTLTLRAAAAGDRIHIEVEDDGAGIEIDVVAQLARSRGVIAADEPLQSERLLDVLCTPGFSTRSEIDMTSGRGVGMDVVRSTVRALGGEMSLHTTPGRGTRFAIDLPLTLMIVDALLVDIGGQQMAVPQPSLREILQIESASITRIENNEVISYMGSILPLIRLSTFFGLPPANTSTTYVLVVGSENAPTGLLVDRLNGLREIVVHPVVDPLVAMPGIAGATELGNGHVSLILDAGAVLRFAQQRRGARSSSDSTKSPANAILSRGMNGPLHSHAAVAP